MPSGTFDILLSMKMTEPTSVAAAGVDMTTPTGQLAMSRPFQDHPHDQ